MSVVHKLIEAYILAPTLRHRKKQAECASHGTCTLSLARGSQCRLPAGAEHGGCPYDSQQHECAILAQYLAFRDCKGDKAQWDGRGFNYLQVSGLYDALAATSASPATRLVKRRDVEARQGDRSNSEGVCHPPSSPFLTSALTQRKASLAANTLASMEADVPGSSGITVAQLQEAAAAARPLIQAAERGTFLPMAVLPSAQGHGASVTARVHQQAAGSGMARIGIASGAVRSVSAAMSDAAATAVEAHVVGRGNQYAKSTRRGNRQRLAELWHEYGPKSMATRRMGSKRLQISSLAGQDREPYMRRNSTDPAYMGSALNGLKSVADNFTSGVSNDLGRALGGEAINLISPDTGACFLSDFYFKVGPAICNSSTLRQLVNPVSTASRCSPVLHPGSTLIDAIAHVINEQQQSVRLWWNRRLLSFGTEAAVDYAAEQAEQFLGHEHHCCIGRVDVSGSTQHFSVVVSKHSDSTVTTRVYRSAVQGPIVAAGGAGSMDEGDVDIDDTDVVQIVIEQASSFLHAVCHGLGVSDVPVLGTTHVSSTAYIHEPDQAFTVLRPVLQLSGLLGGDADVHAVRSKLLDMVVNAAAAVPAGYAWPNREDPVAFSHPFEPTVRRGASPFTPASGDSGYRLPSSSGRTSARVPQWYGIRNTGVDCYLIAALHVGLRLIPDSVLVMTPLGKEVAAAKKSLKVAPRPADRVDFVQLPGTLRDEVFKHHKEAADHPQQQQDCMECIDSIMDGLGNTPIGKPKTDATLQIESAMCVVERRTLIRCSDALACKCGSGLTSSSSVSRSHVGIDLPLPPHVGSGGSTRTTRGTAASASSTSTSVQPECHYLLSDLMDATLTCDAGTVACNGSDDCKGGPWRSDVKKTGEQRFTANAYLRYANAPKQLILHLRRFGQNAATSRHFKNEVLVHFGRRFDWKWWDASAGHEQVATYRIVALVLHMGTLHGGHYTCNKLEDDNCWWHYDDATVTFLERDVPDSTTPLPSLETETRKWDIRKHTYVIVAEKI